MPERVYRHPSKASSKSGSAHMLKIKIEFRESVAPHWPFGRRLFGTMSEDAGGDSDRDLDQKKYYWHQKKYPKGSRKTGINKKIPLGPRNLYPHQPLSAPLSPQLHTNCSHRKLRC